MKFSELIETIKLAGDSMKSNKLRSFLAALGVVIGISFVILTGWVIAGLDNALKETINLFGEDMLYVDKWDWTGEGNWRENEARKDITYRQAMTFYNQFNSGELAVPVVRKWAVRIKANNDNFEGIVGMGTMSEYGRTAAGSVEKGRFFTKSEDNGGAYVVAIGSKVAELIFPDENPIGKKINIMGRKFEVIGVVKKQGTMLMDFVDNQVYLPLNTFMSIFGGQLRRSMWIAVKAGDKEFMDQTREEIRGLMRNIRNLEPHEKDDFSINEMKALEESIASIRMYVWGVGMGLTLLSFIVGIIGIMNIMFVSVAERTKEIGIRKAIGAKSSSILLQFVIESATLCFVGAVSSFIFCSVVIFLAATFLPKAIPTLTFLNPVMPYEFLVIGSVVSIVVGILAGFLPALRAARLDPVEALRFEN